ncbi:MAG: tyrosine-type recombinase/integrase, partial [Mycobacterium sp.]
MSRKGVAGQRKQIPSAWQWAIEDYLRHLAATGQREATRTLRGNQLRYLARCIGCPPEDVTAAMLVDWFGQQTWSPECRRSYRSAVRGFFSWGYNQGRVPVYLGDVLPRLPQLKATPRPAPDDAWATAVAAADDRTRLMLRLAGEAGLRRAEVAQVNTRDVFISRRAAQLVVHGKGGKQRVVPISDDLAEAIRRGAAGHTPGMPSHGWLFPDGFGGHLSPLWVGTVVARVLPEGYT